jgi:hypothetical protein
MTEVPETENDDVVTSSQSEPDSRHDRWINSTNAALDTGTQSLPQSPILGTLDDEKTTVSTDRRNGTPCDRQDSGRQLDSMDESTQTVRQSNATRTISEQQRLNSGNNSRHRRFSNMNADPSDDYLNSPVSCKEPGTVVRKVRLLSGLFVENPKVQVAIILLIVVNAIMMGIATFDFVADHERTDRAFALVDTILLSLFTLEIALQFCYRGLRMFLDSWLCFDAVVILLSWSLASTQVIRAFRIFRAVRLVTRIGPLRELITAIGAVMPRMYAITMLLLLIFYIYSVLFTELFGEMELSQNYFGSLTQSLFTCMQLMTMEWSDIAREVMAQKTWAWAPFLSYIAITGFIVFNLIVAVVCDAVAVIDREAKYEREGPFESDANKLLEAQERIYELSRQVAAMKSQQTKLCLAVVSLTEELQNALTELERLTDPSEAEPLPSAEDRPLVCLTPIHVSTYVADDNG